LRVPQFAGLSQRINKLSPHRLAQAEKTASPGLSAEIGHAGDFIRRGAPPPLLSFAYSLRLHMTKHMQSSCEQRQFAPENDKLLPSEPCGVISTKARLRSP
jgi:hypothetical protein